jgi:ABC-type multidrug transport system permease subunit
VICHFVKWVWGKNVVCMGWDSFVDLWLRNERNHCSKFVYFGSDVSLSQWLMTSSQNNVLQKILSPVPWYSSLHTTLFVKLALLHINIIVAQLLSGWTPMACGVCPLSSTNSFLGSFGSKYEERWCNLGIFVAFICLNVTGTCVLYWLARFPRTRKFKSH